MTTLKEDILALVKKHHQFPDPTFIAGQTPIPVSGKVYNEHDVSSVIEAGLDFWLTTGRFNDDFEKKLSQYIGVKYLKTVNSGSSANLCAFTALTSPWHRDRAIQKGDEVITVAAGFPTTVNPIIQNGCVPVFLDVDMGTYNINTAEIEQAITPKTKAIMVAHTLGNPIDLAPVMEIVKKYNLRFVEDCCDALGATYKGQMVGTFGDIGTLSFYPAHHITMGEGGAVFTNNGIIKRAMESVRDWGRDCWCDPGKDNTCEARFNWQLGDLPKGYDHKYIYSHLGYNLKISDMQAAVGLSQLEHLESFTQKRKENFSYLHKNLQFMEKYMILPKATPHSDPSWFGFLLTLREDAPFNRLDILQFLAERKIANRLLFGGNLIKQPYMKNQLYRVASDLTNTNIIMHNSFWVGVYPGLTQEMLDYICQSFADFIAKY